MTESINSVFSGIDKITRTNFDVTVSKLKDGLTDYSLKSVEAATSQMTLTKEQATAIFTAKGLSEAELDAAVKTATLSAAEKEATASTLGLKTAAKGLWATMTAHPIMSITSAVGVAISLYSMYKRSIEEARQAVRDEAKAYADTSKSIEDYTKKYQELHQALLDAKGNEEETYNVKKQLFDLQTKLNDEYGTEYDNINLTTDAYKDQTQALKDLSVEKANKFLSETDPSEIARIEDEMTVPKSYSLSSMYIPNDDTEYSMALKNIANKYNDQGIAARFINTDLAGDTFEIRIDANVEDAEKTVTSFITDLRNKAKELGDEDMFNGVIGDAQRTLKQLQETLKTDGPTWDTLQQAQIESSPQLSSEYDKLTQAVKDYNDVVLKSANPFQDDKVFAAYDHLKAIKAEIQDNEEEWGKYSSVTNKVFDQADTKIIDFAEKIKNNDLSLGSIVKDVKKLNLSDVDLETALSDISPGTVFQSLDARMKHYGVTIEEVTSLFVKLGVVQDNFSKDQPLTKTKEEMISSINALSDGFESLDKIMSSMKGKDPFNYALLDDKKFKDTFSTVGKEYSDFVEQISSSPKDVKACQEAFNNLVTAWINSGDVLDGLSDNTKQLTIDMLEQRGVLNAEEVVTAALAQRHAEAAWSSKNLTNATADEIKALADESETTDDARKSFENYIVQKMLAEVALDPSGDITALANVVNALGLATDAWKKYYNIKAQMAATQAAIDSGGTVLTPHGAGGQMSVEEYQNQLESDASAYLNSYAKDLEKMAQEKASYGGGPKANKSGSGGGSKSKSKDPTKFDWMSQKIKIID